MAEFVARHRAYEQQISREYEGDVTIFIPLTISLTLDEFNQLSDRLIVERGDIGLQYLLSCLLVVKRKGGEEFLRCHASDISNNTRLTRLSQGCPQRLRTFMSVPDQYRHGCDLIL